MYILLSIRVYMWCSNTQYVLVCILHNMILLYCYIFKDCITLLYKEGMHSCHYFYHNFTHDSYNRKLLLRSATNSHFMGYQLSNTFKKRGVKLVLHKRLIDDSIRRSRCHEVPNSLNPWWMLHLWHRLHTYIKHCIMHQETLSILP